MFGGEKSDQVLMFFKTVGLSLDVTVIIFTLERS